MAALIGLTWVTTTTDARRRRRGAGRCRPPGRARPSVASGSPPPGALVGSDRHRSHTSGVTDDDRLPVELAVVELDPPLVDLDGDARTRQRCRPRGAAGWRPRDRAVGMRGGERSRLRPPAVGQRWVGVSEQQPVDVRRRLTVAHEQQHRMTVDESSSGRAADELVDVAIGAAEVLPGRSPSPSSSMPRLRSSSTAEARSSTAKPITGPVVKCSWSVSLDPNTSTWWPSGSSNSQKSGSPWMRRSPSTSAKNRARGSARSDRTPAQPRPVTFTGQSDHATADGTPVRSRGRWWLNSSANRADA